MSEEQVSVLIPSSFGYWFSVWVLAAPVHLKLLQMLLKILQTKIRYVWQNWISSSLIYHIPSQFALRLFDSINSKNNLIQPARIIAHTGVFFCRVSAFAAETFALLIR